MMGQTMRGLTAIMIIMAIGWKVKYDNNVRMMLTGQVFAIMSGTADEKTGTGSLRERRHLSV